jgi:hypothetical protein
MCVLKHKKWKEALMTDSLPPGKSVKWGRLIIGGVLSVLVIATALLWFSYKRDPAPFIRFYWIAKYGINIGDGGVISGVPCSSPCVFGIRAGETQFDQVLPTLEKNGITISNCLTEPNISWFLFNCGVGRLNVQVDTHTNIVNGVWLLPNDSISLGEIIEKYGDPNFLLLSPEIGPEGPATQMFIYWDSIRMGVVLPKVDGKIYIVKNTTVVEGIGFSDETTYQGSHAIEVGTPYPPWNGYGAYQQ